MTSRLAATLAALALLAGAGHAGAQSSGTRPLREPGRDGLVVSRLPYARQPQYRTFEAKCSRCHELSRALDADFDADRWRQYLKRKERRTGAKFSARQGEEIYQFLAWWSERRAEASRSAP
jgi:hypothetical protein